MDRDLHSRGARPIRQQLQQVSRTFRLLFGENLIPRLQPFRRLLRILIDVFSIDYIIKCGF